MEQDTTAMEQATTTNEDTNSNPDMFKYKFNFREDKLGNRRPSVELSFPVPASVEAILEIIEAGGKGLELLQESVRNTVLNHVRQVVSENETISQDTLPLEKISWEFIANITPKERTGGGISKETWEAFAEDYIAVMPAIAQKTTEQVTNAAKIFLAKFSGSVKTNKPIIAKLSEQLALYASTPNAESFADCVEFLAEKADRLLNMTDEDLMKNLDV